MTTPWRRCARCDGYMVSVCSRRPRTAIRNIFGWIELGSAVSNLVTVPVEMGCYVCATCKEVWQGGVGQWRVAKFWIRRWPPVRTGRADLMTRASVDIAIPVLNEQTSYCE